MVKDASVSSTFPDAAAEQPWIQDYIVRVRKKSAKLLPVPELEPEEMWKRFFGRIEKDDPEYERKQSLIWTYFEKAKKKEELQAANQHLDLFGAAAFEKRQKDRSANINMKFSAVIAIAVAVVAVASLVAVEAKPTRIRRRGMSQEQQER
ncbi:hypothetical protein BDF22DRAFT_742100 [Syncephalis plumigaleata]|nr:hypothetical protein BDF22DRAFT_742100 [Syncephalis plumigaleata]